MRIAIYVRVSTQRQAEMQSIDQQIERLRKHVEDQGWPLPEDHVFRDDGYSGASLKRPGLDRLRDRAALASFDAVFLTDPDRLARNYVHQVLLIEELQKHGCRVEFLDRPMSQDPHDQLLLQIRGAVAEYERTLIAERTRRGRQRRSQAGQMLPWTRAPYGYRMAMDRPRDPSGVSQDPTEAAVVAEIFAWYLEGRHTLHGLVDHLRELGVPSPSGKPYWSGASVRGILKNPISTGRIYASRTRYRDAKVRRSATHPIGRPHGTAEPVPTEEWIEVGTVPAVVTQEQFDRAQAKLAANLSFSARNNKVGCYLLRSLISCGRCGLACMARRLPPRNSYYVCTGKSRAARHRNGATCRSRYIPSRAIDDLVWHDLCELLRHPEAVADAFRRASVGAWHPQEFQARRERLRQGRASLAQQLERLTEASLGGVIPLPEYQRRRVEIEARGAALAEQESRLAGEADRLDQALGLATSLESFCERASQGLQEATFDQRRQLVELLIDRVVVTDDEIEIRYVFPTCPQSEHVRFCHLRSDYFHDPPPGPSHIPLRAGRTPHHLDPRAGRSPHQPLLEPVVVVLRVGPQQLQPATVFGCQLTQDLGGERLVIGRGDRDHDDQQQPQGVHDDVSLPPGDLLAPVGAPLVGDLGRLDGLAVAAPGAGRRLLPGGDPHLPTQGVEDLLPGAVGLPLGEVVGNGALGRQVVGEQIPLAAAAVEVEDGVEHLPHVDRAGPADGVDGDQGRDDFPLLVGQVGGVGLTHRGRS
ncbi:MAG: recombinase family protein, partial [Planctomycetaceae bacterium]|nr:recombinase family protein [Planctomycetaceae bacterium]